MMEHTSRPSEHHQNNLTTNGHAAGPPASVAGLVTAGLPLEAGLQALSEEAPTRRVRRILKQMSYELAQGKSPDEVLSSGGYGMTGYLRGLVRAGVQTGQLGAFLEQFLTSLRRRRAAKLSFWGMMAYPLLLMPLLFLATMFLVGWIVPQFRDLFNDFGVELPSMTLALLSLSTTPVLMAVFVGIPALLVVIALVILLGRFVPGHAWRVRMFQQIPLIGNPSRMRGHAEFCSLLGLLVSGRIPLPDALRMTSAAIQDANLRLGARQLATRVEQGESLELGARELPQFSRELVHAFRWESRGDAFGDLLLRSGEIYSSGSQVQAGVMIMILQPIILTGIALFAGFVVLALFMPLVKLLNMLA